MKIKLKRGLSVRTGEGDNDFRRLGEVGDVIDVDDVPEWEGTVPPHLLSSGKVVVVGEEAPPATEDSKDTGELVIED